MGWLGLLIATGVLPAGAVLLWQVATGATKDALTKTDRRYQITGAGARLAAHLAATVPPSPGSTVLTYTGAQLTKVEEKDGTGTVIKTTNLNYDVNGVLTSTAEIVNGKTTTTTLNRDGSGVLTSVTRSVA